MLWHCFAKYCFAENSLKWNANMFTCEIHRFVLSVASFTVQLFVPIWIFQCWCFIRSIWRIFKFIDIIFDGLIWFLHFSKCKLRLFFECPEPDFFCQSDTITVNMALLVYIFYTIVQVYKQLIVTTSSEMRLFSWDNEFSKKSVNASKNCVTITHNKMVAFQFTRKSDSDSANRNAWSEFKSRHLFFVSLIYPSKMMKFDILHE